MTHTKSLLALLFLALCPLGPSIAAPVQGIAMHGTPKHGPHFTHFPYVNPDAPKGGRLVLGTLGTFDSLTPFIIKGVSPASMREYVYASLLTRSGDEAFSLYGLIAESVELPEDRSQITFHLRPEARFSDGAPITPEDVLFSHEVLKQKGWPYHRSHYAKVARAEKISERAVRFTFDAAGDREIPMILGLMPILPKHKTNLDTFEQTSLEAPIGNGPYTVARVDAGRSITYKRIPDWWGANLPVARGRFNFDEVRVEYFRDAASLFEAFKAGEIDMRVEEDPGRWLEGYRFPAVAEGRVVKREFETGLPAGMSALVFNTRRPAFRDERVRRAFILLFDAEWINRNLFNGLYQRTQSFFERSELSSAGRPADARERALLAPFATDVKAEILAGSYRFPNNDGGGDNRANMQAAFKLLGEAGYRLENNTLVKDGSPLSFEFLAQTRQQERLMLSYARTLERLGISVRIRQVDTSQYWARLKNYDFDMIQWTWGASLSPGNEQINRWSSKAAGIEGTLNYPGVENAAVDAMIDALLQAEAADDFVAAVRALDRALLSGDYVIPLFYLPRVWVAYWSHLRLPGVAPLAGVDVDTWWTERAN
ncbi:MAG TPA: extracellular solute-binding protein [Hyphomicrobiaceae bacterium]|jgi:peptide/nickel transport system substrate-binding protein|nr:extracellular solute-binding protein [Hyphomicrobiaceae bacterium]